ncbi:MAG: type IV toxin-antitoxin system AbiEi family antitoxin [Saprospiraceae bacterium]
MSTQNTSKINQLLRSQPSGIVMLTSWLGGIGYSLDLLKRYRKSQWLESIGRGALKRAGDDVGYEGAIYALQIQSGMSAHPAARTALSIIGRTQYLELSPSKIVVFGNRNEALPAWFVGYDWGVIVDYHQSSFLPSEIGLTEVQQKDFSIKVSSAERAILECLYLAPGRQELLECYELLEGLNTLRPLKLQLLLEQCSSVKVKRLFLYMAEKIGHEWFRILDLERIGLGSGKRSIVKNGVYVAKYKITVPKELGAYDSGFI